MPRTSKEQRYSIMLEKPSIYCMADGEQVFWKDLIADLEEAEAEAERLRGALERSEDWTARCLKGLTHAAGLSWEECSGWSIQEMEEWVMEATGGPDAQA